MKITDELAQKIMDGNFNPHFKEVEYSENVFTFDELA